MNAKSLLRHVIVCDDVRREVNGKELLIGVYTGGVKFNGPAPGKLRVLCFRFEFGPDLLESRGQVRFQLLSPSGATVINASPTTPLVLSNTIRTVYVLSREGLFLYEPGAYRLRFGLDAEPEDVDTLDVSFEEKP
jgi:hypothetical protein